MEAAADSSQPEDVFSTFVFPCSDGFATRDYQFNIIQKALLKNTLVVLPTGLGKTFIAAVVMYNYLRWFPASKVIFLAPTRPLVKQQIEACHEVVGIDEKETAEMNGQTSAQKRAKLWQTKRVFYCTPQSLEKDLQCEGFPKHEVSLIVIDEAHRAVGKYAFVTTVEMLAQCNPKFRVLALSATPGKDLAKVQEVCTNLLVSNIEYKSENDFDVKPYVFQKLMEVVMCENTLENLNVLAEWIELIDLPLKRIAQMKVYSFLPPAKDISKYMAIKQLNAVGDLPDLQAKQMGILRGEWGLLCSLLHVKDLFRDGMATASKYLEETFDDGKDYGPKRQLINDPKFARFKEKLRNSVLAGQGSPKIVKLTQVLEDHFARFAEAGKRTSVIVFSQYRDSVGEICKALKLACPEIRVSPFVGQASKSPSSSSKQKTTATKKALSSKKPAAAAAAAAAEDDTEEEDWEKSEGEDAPLDDRGNEAGNGQKQKEQQEVVRKFRNGEIDVIVATCIGEEGLDIGSVDLVISFDALQSPVRMIQRFGRAGRKRAGRVLVLVADEKERQTFTSGTKQGQSMHKLLRENQWKIRLFIPPAEFGMFPQGFKPKVSYQKLAISKYQSDLVGGTKPKRTSGEEGKRNWSQITDHERLYLAIRFDGADFALAAPPRESTEHYTKRWRFLANGALVSTSQRSKLVQQLARQVVADASVVDLASSATSKEEDEELLSFSVFHNRPHKAAFDPNREVTTDDGEDGSQSTTDDQMMMMHELLSNPLSLITPLSFNTAMSAENREEEEEVESDGGELVPKPPSTWDSGEDLDCFPAIANTPRKVAILQPESQPPPAPLVVATVIALDDNESQSPFAPQRRRTGAAAAESQSPFAPQRKSAAIELDDSSPEKPPPRKPSGRKIVVQESPSTPLPPSFQKKPRLGESEEERALKPKRSQRREQMVRRAFIASEAECDEDDDGGEEEEEEGEDLDQDLDSFIDDSTPCKQRTSSSNPSEDSGSDRKSCFSKSPMDRIGLVHKSSRVAKHYGNGVIGQTLQNLKHRMENGLAPPSVDEEEDDEDYADSQESYDLAQHSEAEEGEERSPVSRTLDFTSEKEDRTAVPCAVAPAKNAPLVGYVPTVTNRALALPKFPPVVLPQPKSLLNHPQPVPSKRQLGLERLFGAKTASAPPPPAVAPIVLLPPPPRVVPPPVVSSAAPTTALKPALVYNHCNAQSAALIRGFAAQFDLLMCPHIDFFGADCILSSLVSVKIVTMTDLMDEALEHWLTAIVQRTPQVILVLYLVDDAQQHMFNTNAAAQSRAVRLRSQNFPGVQLTTAKSTLVLGNMLQAFVKREIGNKRRNVFAPGSQWRQVLWKQKPAIEFLSQLPGSNVVLALGLVLHFTGRNMVELVRDTDSQLLCHVLAPDLPPTQAQTLLAALGSRPLPNNVYTL
ncbi:hypothetical protein BASA81_004158 [Batrachochytrium salamandrivorans]|nr:hypothetical protein BASA81_004158 [Batrachochytrium salamandrivorans]